jgi:E3 ubiquitin-protein ligase synoviolin
MFTLREDFLKLITYLVFFVLVLIYYGLPLNIIRDVYITGRSFYQRARDLMRYRAATKNMDERYPDATTSELQAMSDKTCIICREELVSKTENESENTEDKDAEIETSDKNGPNTTPKKLPCGHIFHFHCLRSWLERQQSCPTW